VSTVVVTGASGSLGRRVVDLLTADPQTERVVAIDVVPGRPDHPRVEHRVIDLSRPDGQLDTVLDGASTVIHLAWSPGGANLASTALVLDAAARAGVGQIVHLSSATVYGAWPDNPVPLAEDAAIRPNPGFDFAVEKAEAERLIAEWAEAHGDAALAVLRPAVTVGSTGPALYRALAGSRGPRSPDGGRPVQFLHVEDLASAVVLACRQRLRGVYNVSPDGWIAEDNARALAGGVARVTLPGRLARLVSAWRWRLLRSGTPPEALPYALHPWVVANDRLVAAGWAAAHSNEEALVTADDRVHWGELSPGRRQRIILAASLGVVLAAGAGTVAGVAALAARRRTR
jgi:nucleoside-diphosphate-sugar epimerase